jgi:hypothetical protein
MKILHLILGCLVLGASQVWADVQPPPAVLAPTGTTETLELDLTCILPADGPAVERGELMVRLYEYDPRKADGGATEIARVTLSGIAHRTGEETVVRFPCAGKTARRKSYYLTAVVYPEASATASAGLYFIDGFQRVLVGGNREVLGVTLAPVDAEANPSN